MWLVLINTVISVAGVVLGIFVASGSVISIANMQVSWAAALLLVAFGIPVMFGISGIGVWLAYLFGGQPLIPYLIALPWGYSLLFVTAMLTTFNYLS